MQPRIVLLLAFFCLALLTRQVVGGDAVRSDRYGDPLPPGVVVRLGSERLMLGRARFLTFSSDGRRLAAQSATRELRIWDVPSGKVLFLLRTANSSGITGRNPLALSPDGKTVALANGGEFQRAGKPQATVRIWEVATGKELHFFGGFKGSEFNLAFSPDGRYLFCGGSQAPLLRWNLSNGGAPKEYGKFYAVDFLAVSRDGKTLTAVTHERGDWPKRTFVCWETATGKEIGRHTLATAGAWPGRLSPDGGVYAAPSVGGKSIALLDPLTGRETCQARESDSPDLISISADGATMTSTSRKGGIRVWDVAAGKLRASSQPPFANVEWTALSPDGKWLVLSGRKDGAVHLWDVAAGRELRPFAGHRSGPLTIAFLNDGKEIVTANREGRPHAHFSHYVTWNKEGQPLVHYVRDWADFSFRRWDAAGVERSAISPDAKDEVWHTSFSADGRLLATVIQDGSLHLWDVASGRELRSWKGPTRESTTTHFNPKGGKKAVTTPYPATTTPVFSPDGKILLAGYGPKIHRWQTATGRELPAFEIKEIAPQMMTCCLPSPDGRTLAVWSTGIGHLILLDGDSALEINGSKEARRALAGFAEVIAEEDVVREAKASLARLRSRPLKP